MMGEGTGVLSRLLYPEMGPFPPPPHPISLTLAYPHWSSTVAIVALNSSTVPLPTPPLSCPPHNTCRCMHASSSPSLSTDLTNNASPPLALAKLQITFRPILRFLSFTPFLFHILQMSTLTIPAMRVPRRSPSPAAHRFSPPPVIPKNILVTGGAGYIGSHTVLQLLLGGYRTVVVDNLENSSIVAIQRVAELAGELAKNLIFHQIDIRDREALDRVFALSKFDAVIHFAGLKAVGESVAKPLLYYNNNITGTITLLEVMTAHGCKKLVFSSSATVYGWPKIVPCSEESPIGAMNPYGRTKLLIEEICRDVYQADNDWKIMLLRYFNPVGAHPSGIIGEDPRGFPNNLMPYIQQVAVGRRQALTVHGNGYGTKDGTGVRDYIHVVDLADGHIAALDKIFDDCSEIGCEVYNLGTGKGTSVLEMVAAFERASGKKIPLVIGGRRPGDAEILYATTTKAEKELNWKTKYGIEEMCSDQWNWACKNPWGYESANENGR